MEATAARWPERMNASDAMFWYLDAVPELRSTFGTLLMLGGAPAPGRLRAAFLRLARALPRMRQRAVEAPLNLAPPEWIDDAQFDLDYHLRTIAVPAPGGMLELLAELGPLFATPVDRERPLWEAYVAEGLPRGRTAIFLKMHHCLMDGVGGSQLFSKILGERCDEQVLAPPVATPPRSLAYGARMWRALQYDLTEALDAGAAAASALTNAVAHPWRTLRDVPAAAQRALGFGRELAVPRADSPLHQERSLSRRLATFQMSLGEIDDARHVLAATNNDVVLTIVSGAMHRWHTSRGADVRELRALVPINLRPSDDGTAGNRIALLAMSLPIGEPDAVARLRIIQERMSTVKRDQRAVLYPAFARALTMLPLALAAELGRQQTFRTNFVCTNVPGPRHACYLAGEEIEQVYPYAPLVGDHPVGIALYSYRDTIYVGLDVDPLAMDDLPHFVDALSESYAEILNLSRHAPVAALPLDGAVRSRASAHG